MSVNKDYGDLMNNGVEELIKNSEYNKSTNHVVFDSAKVTLPEGITNESLSTHVGFINDLTAQTEVAVSQIARSEFENNNKLSTVDGTLSFDGFQINSQHHLRMKVGDDEIFGQGTTAVNYHHSDEQAVWLESQRTASVEEAKKLFG